MKAALGLAVLGLASCAAAPARAPVQGRPSRLDNQIALYFGERHLDEDDWEPVDEQVTLGIEYSHESPGSAVGFEVGVMGSTDDDAIGAVDVEARTGEIYGGIHKTFGDDIVRPYVGGGLAMIRVEADFGPGDDDDASFAGYVHGGLAVAASEAFHIALDLRFLLGSDVDIAGVDMDADYGQLALVLAVGF